MKKENKIQFHIPWEKIGIAVVLIFFLIFGIMVLHFRMTYHSPTERYHENTKYEFVWDGNTRKGIYDGDFQNTQPNGKGKFTSSDGSFTYEGDWEKGLFSGEGRITYEDGSIELGEFTEGKRNGYVKKYASEEAFTEKSYTETIYDMNVPYARSDTYEKDSFSTCEYYVNATPVSEIKENAKLLTEKLIKKEDYYNTYVYVEGKVEFVGDTAGSCYFRVNTDSIGMLYCGYDNTYGLTSEQRYIPTLKEGDNVTIYGYYMGLSKYSIYTDEEWYGNKFPKIMPFIVEVTDAAEKADNSSDKTQDCDIRVFTNNNPNITYSNFLSNPYIFSMHEIDDTFVIKDSVKAGINYTITAYKEDKPEELYILLYEGDVMDRFSTGMILKVNGHIVGQTKKVSTETRDELIDEGSVSGDIVTYDFTRYPVIQLDEIKE